MQVVKCDSINIGYDSCGIATITMSVYADTSNIDVSILPVEFGGIRFNITQTDISGRQVDQSGIYMFSVSLRGKGIRVGG